MSVAFLQESATNFTRIELTIRLRSEDINVREFGAFLSTIDAVYGRITRINYLSYSLSHYNQIRISEIRQGSTELIVADIITQAIQATPYLVLLLFVRYLGIGVKGLSEVTKNFADSYKSLREGRVAKANEKKILSDMEQDEILKDLTPARRRQLVTLLAELEKAERKRIPAARRFAKKNLLEAKLSRKKIDKS
jgi:hypothetical protein